jgi:hypothetical protein
VLLRQLLRQRLLVLLLAQLLLLLPASLAQRPQLLLLLLLLRRPLYVHAADACCCCCLGLCRVCLPLLVCLHELLRGPLLEADDVTRLQLVHAGHTQHLRGCSEDDVTSFCENAFLVCQVWSRRACTCSRQMMSPG